MKTICIGLALGALCAGAHGDTVDFRVDDELFDADMDGFITGSELALTGTDGTVWTFMPTGNLVGGDRFLVNEERGLLFGGGGGSSTTFEFTVDNDVTLEMYQIPDTIFVLGNPTFQILLGDDLLSDDNDADLPGFFGFEGGSIDLEAGSVYTVDVTTTGAGIQSYFSTWEYTGIPSPGSVALIAMGGVVGVRRRR